MKLKLSNEKDVAILDVLEEVSHQNIPVLRAGITKFLRSGRNKIIINLTEAREIDIETLKELIKLHLLACELKGNIMLVGQGELIRKAAKTFLTPLGIKHFQTRDTALAAMAESKSAAAALGSEGAPQDKLQERIAILETANKALKLKTSGLDTAQLRKLRLENSVLRSQIEAIQDRLNAFRKDPRLPIAMDREEGVEAKLKILSEALIGFVKEARAVK